MRSSWTEVAPQSNMSVLIRDRKVEDTEHKAEGYMKTVAENGVMPPQTKEHQGISGERHETTTPQSLRKEPTLQTV